MTRKLLVLISLVSAVSSVAAVDLTPLVTEYKSQGFTYTKLAFKDDAGSVAYNPPLKWTYRGSGGRLQLTPPDKPFADAAIEAVRLPAPAQLDATMMDALAKHVIATLPPGSQNVAVVSQTENPVTLNNLPTLEVIVGYETVGQAFQKGVIVCNSGDTQLVFHLAAKKTDFAELYQAFRGSINSWHKVEPAASPANGTASASSATP